MALGGIGGGIGGLIGGIAVLAGAGGKGGDKYYRKALDQWKGLQTPEFDMSNLSAPEMRMLAELYPEIYEAVVPDSAKTIAGSPEGRQGQLQSLGRLQEYASGGQPLLDRLNAQDAAGAVADEHTRTTDSMMRNLGERGRLGAGTEIQARLAAGAQGDNLANQLGSSMARDRVMARLSATGQAGNLAGAIRSQDVNQQGQNASIINRFNEMITGRRGEAARYAADAKNQANVYNTTTQQGIGDRNVLNRYNTQSQNLDRRNSLKQDKFNAELQKVAGLSGQFGAYGQAKDQNKAAKERTIMNMSSGGGQAAGGILGSGLI